jgi:hypothetical protein
MSNFQAFLTNLQTQWAIRGKRKAKHKPQAFWKKLLNATLLAFILLLILFAGLVAFMQQHYAVTTHPQAELVMDNVAGIWSGTAELPGGRTQVYQIVLRQDGDFITGEAYSADNNGNLTAYLSGSYVDGWLMAEESGGTLEGWEAVCYWSIELQTAGDVSSPMMSGVFHRLASGYGSCSGSGTIELTRQ